MEMHEYEGNYSSAKKSIDHGRIWPVRYISNHSSCGMDMLLLIKEVILPEA
jgi:hypothetical protein